MADRRSGVPRRSQDAMRDRRVARVDLIARIMLASDGVYIVIAALTAPDSVAHVMAVTEGGRLVTAMLALCSVLICADVLINDLMPPQFKLIWVRDRRRWLYYATAYFCLLPIWTAATAGLSRPSATFLYLSMAIAGFALGFRDALSLRRSRERCDT